MDINVVFSGCLFSLYMIVKSNFWWNIFFESDQVFLCPKMGTIVIFEFRGSGQPVLLITYGQFHQLYLNIIYV